jgi:hypothetical protein
VNRHLSKEQMAERPSGEALEKKPERQFRRRWREAAETPRSRRDPSSLFACDLSNVSSSSLRQATDYPYLASELAIYKEERTLTCRYIYTPHRSDDHQVSSIHLTQFDFLDKGAMPRMIPNFSTVSVHAEHADYLAVLLEIDCVVTVEVSDALDM